MAILIRQNSLILIRIFFSGRIRNGNYSRVAGWEVVLVAHGAIELGAVSAEKHVKTECTPGDAHRGLRYLAAADSNLLHEVIRVLIGVGRDDHFVSAGRQSIQRESAIAFYLPRIRPDCSRVALGIERMQVNGERAQIRIASAFKQKRPASVAAWYRYKAQVV